MKKALLLFVLMSLTLFTRAQENNYEELKFFKVIQSENNADKNSLYAALRSFMAIYYANSQNVIQMDDKDAGILIGKATSVFDSPSMMLSAYEGWLDYNLKLQARDGRVRVEVSHFFHHNKPGNQKKAQLGVLTKADEYTDKGMQKKYHNKVWLMLKEQAAKISSDIFVNVEKVIKEGATIQSEDDNW